jgi:hypothetical protein
VESLRSQQVTPKSHHLGADLSSAGPCRLPEMAKCTWQGMPRMSNTTGWHRSLLVS